MQDVFFTRAYSVLGGMDLILHVFQSCAIGRSAYRLRMFKKFLEIF